MNSKREILDILRDDATTNEQTIAAMLGIGEDEVAAAIAELKEQGIIMKYSAILNSEAMGEEAPAEAMIPSWTLAMRTSRAGFTAFPR